MTTEDGEVIELTETVDCYFVRRELHSLSALDWSRFLDTYLVKEQ